MIQKRSIATCIILSIVTCGIYGLYWLYCMANDVNTLSDKPGTAGGTVVILSIVTCSIYLFYWMYITGNKIDELRTQKGLSAGNNGLIYLLLSIFGFSIIAYALMQNELNNLAA